jgi:hypothetical protein
MTLAFAEVGKNTKNAMGVSIILEPSVAQYLPFALLKKI